MCFHGNVRVKLAASNPTFQGTIDLSVGNFSYVVVAFENQAMSA